MYQSIVKLEQGGAERMLSRNTSVVCRSSSLRIVAIAAAALIAGCGTVMTSTPSGFLSSYEGLQPAANGSSARRVPLAFVPSHVDVVAVEWRTAGDSAISDLEKAALRDRLRTELQASLNDLPVSPGGRAIVLRAAITRVEPVSPALNTASSLLLLVPLERGGAAVEMEAVDAQTGQQLAAMRSGYFPPMTELKARFSKLAPAEIALKRAASDFLRLLQAS